MIRISLVIATYNRATPLMEVLGTVTAQDLPAPEWECVVVDNNSHDDTQQRFAAFAATHPAYNLRIVREAQQGLSHARNRGIAESTAPYIAIIDDDERINPGFLSAYAALFDADPSAVAAGGEIIASYPSGRPAWMSRYTEIPIANPMSFGSCVRPFPAGKIPGGGNMAFRREALVRCGAFDPALGRVGGKLTGGEESDLFERLRRAGEELWYVPGAVMWHIIPPEKLTEEYFRRLCYNIGVSQRTRALIHHRLLHARLSELFKWGATLVLCCTMTPLQSRWLFLMRRQITRGMFSR